MLDRTFLLQVKNVLTVQLEAQIKGLVFGKFNIDGKSHGFQ